MTLVELLNWAEARTPEIRVRAKNGSGCQLTKKYAATEDDNEVGYVALDWRPLSESTNLVIYELYVPHHLRHRGVGARILIAVEHLARCNNYSRVVLRAKPLEEYPKAKLRSWYKRHGYQWLRGYGPDAMGKDLA